MRNPYLIILVVAAFGFAAAQQPPAQPPEAHAGHHDAVNERGDRVMGFSHKKTEHHFCLLRDGGVIEVAAKDSQDGESRDQIRRHLNHISRKFTDGNFNAPMLIHGQPPPGVPAMKTLKANISYRFEETERGARIIIASENSEAVAAVHEFLRFQLHDHKTGDPGSVEMACPGL
jgi:hypothetical protein